MAFKIAIIGAGSVGFTRKLVADVLCVPELRDVEFALTDIDERNLAMIQRILQTMVEVNRLPTRITATSERRRALEGARYVINCVRIGGLEAFADDIRIPLQYGVDQCVGDTICAGGILYGQRSIPAILDFCRDIRDVAEPGARLLNYANPMAMNTWAAIDHGGVETIGLCHGIQHGWRQIANALGANDPERGRVRLLRHQPPDLVRRRAAARADASSATSWSRPSSGIPAIRSRRRCASTS